MSIKNMKLVVIGDGNVGKTSMLQCFKDNKYVSSHAVQPVRFCQKNIPKTSPVTKPVKNPEFTHFKSP